MRKRWFLVGVIFLLLSWLLVGCGVAQEEHDAVVAQLSTAQKELQSVKVELGEIQTELETVQTELETNKDELAARNTELESLKSEISSLGAEKESLIAEKESLIADQESLQANYDKLNDENRAVKKELAEIKGVYPARHFSSKKELQDWLLTNDVSDRPASTMAEPLYEKALDIQEDAHRDGYIISSYIDYYVDTDIYFVVLEAIAGGDVYVFNPETDDLINLSEFSGLMKVGQ